MLLVSISAPLSMAFLFMSLRDCVPLEESPGQRMVRSAENMAATAKKSLVTYAKLRAKAEKNNQDGRFNRFLEELKEDEAQCRQILELAEQIKALGGRKLPVPLRP